MLPRARKVAARRRSGVQSISVPPAPLTLTSSTAPRCRRASRPGAGADRGIWIDTLIWPGDRFESARSANCVSIADRAERCRKSSRSRDVVSELDPITLE
jgi:hypothetical protein